MKTPQRKRLKKTSQRKGDSKPNRFALISEDEKDCNSSGKRINRIYIDVFPPIGLYVISNQLQIVHLHPRSKR